MRVEGYGEQRKVRGAYYKVKVLNEVADRS